MDDPEPEENDDWVARMRDDRPMNAVCDDVFASCDNNWSQDPGGWRAPRFDNGESPVAVSLRQSRAVQVGHAPARRPEATLIRSARREPVGRRPLLCRSSIVWLAACLMLGAFCFGGAAWFSSVPDRPARAAVPATTRVTYVTKNIEDVRKGETVVAWDPVTGELGRHEVTNTFERTADHLRVLEFAAESDGQTQTLETTDEHPFWSVEAGDFVAAGDLRPGDRFISPAGEFSRLVATHRNEHPEGVPVYNFEVADVHNYYVRAHGLRAPPVRVHNASAFGCGSVKGKTEGHHSDPIFMGGKKNQKLTQLPRGTHRGAGQSLHNDLNSFLRGKTNGLGQHMRPQRGNSGKSIRYNFSPEERLDALAEFYRLNRTKYPTVARDFFDQHPSLE